MASPPASPDDRLTISDSASARPSVDVRGGASAAAAAAIALGISGFSLGDSEAHSPPATTRPREGDDDGDGLVRSRSDGGGSRGADDDTFRPSPPKNRRHGGDSGPDVVGGAGSLHAGSPDKGGFADAFLTGGTFTLSLAGHANPKRASSASGGSGSSRDASGGGGASGHGDESSRSGAAMVLAGSPDLGAAREELDPEVASLRIRELALEKELKRRKGRRD
jgi:hypothetical protein